MLECRHPNILLLIGMTDMPGGSMLVTERSWGPVSTAMSTEPFSSLTALHIAQQIASALSYLSMRRIQHGAVAMGNVWLLKKPSRSRWNMSVNWAANKRFEISKFKFEFPRARTYEMIGLVLGLLAMLRRAVSSKFQGTV